MDPPARFGRPRRRCWRTRCSPPATATAASRSVCCVARSTFSSRLREPDSARAVRGRNRDRRSVTAAAQAVSKGVRVGVRRRGAGPPAIRRAPVVPQAGQVHSRRRRSGERDSAAGSPQHGQPMCSSSWWGRRTVTRTGVSMPSRPATRAKPRHCAPAGLRGPVAAAGGCEPSCRPAATELGPDVIRARRHRAQRSGRRVVDDLAAEDVPDEGDRRVGVRVGRRVRSGQAVDEVTGGADSFGRLRALVQAAAQGVVAGAVGAVAGGQQGQVLADAEPVGDPVQRGRSPGPPAGPADGQAMLDPMFGEADQHPPPRTHPPTPPPAPGPGWEHPTAPRTPPRRPGPAHRRAAPGPETPDAGPGIAPATQPAR